MISEYQGDANSTELTISGDESWKKRGYTSLYGMTSLIGYYSGKIIDIFVKSSYCEKCKTWRKKLKPEEYNDWYEEPKDNCSLNHSGSSGKMEVDAV